MCRRAKKGIVSLDAKHHVHSRLPRRARFTSPRRRLLSRRRSREARVGRVGLRRFGDRAAARTSSTRRRSASARLCAWVRNRCAMITRTPSSVIRLPASKASRCRTSSGSEPERLTLKRSCTAVATLLTFWPPGPEARTKRSSISESSSEMSRVTGIMRKPANFARMIFFTPRQTHSGVGTMSGNVPARVDCLSVLRWPKRSSPL